MPHTLSRRTLLRNATSISTAAALARPFRLVSQSASDRPIVTAPIGTFEGAREQGVRVFRGVPFAEPPVGKLRFRAPVALKASSGVRDATRFASEAMQKAEAGIARSEDCLYLNVWAPAGKGPYPVFVWIHGGGFTGGNSFAPIFDGAGFAQAGIVVVTLAYRLGVFGFMDLEPLLGASYADSANNGTRDLITALCIGCTTTSPRSVAIPPRSPSAGSPQAPRSQQPCWGSRKAPRSSTPPSLKAAVASGCSLTTRRPVWPETSPLFGRPDRLPRISAPLRLPI